MNISGPLLARFHGIARRSGKPVITPEEREKLAALDTEEKRLKALECRYDCNAWQRLRNELMAAFQADPSDENAERLARLPEEKTVLPRYSLVRQLVGDARAKFYREQVAPLVVPILRRALVLVTAESLQLEQTEQAEAMRFEVEFWPSATLQALQGDVDAISAEIACGESGRCGIAPAAVLALEPQSEPQPEQPKPAPAKPKTARAKTVASEDPLA